MICCYSFFYLQKYDYIKMFHPLEKISKMSWLYGGGVGREEGKQAFIS